MDSKTKAYSNPGTPLTVRWAEGSLESLAPENEPRANIGRLVALVFAFVMGLGIFGLSSWLLGERLWVIHSLSGGLLACSWGQRWTKMRLGGKTAELSEQVNKTGTTNEIIKRRLAYAIPGVAIGLTTVALTGWLAGGSHWILDVVIGSFVGRELAIGFGERFRGLPTLNDLALTRTREAMSPIDLKPDVRVPVTLKTAKEVQTKR